eukprot:1476302-Amphidinium_carterae.1
MPAQPKGGAKRATGKQIEQLNALSASSSMTDDELLSRANSILPVLTLGPAAWVDHMSSYYAEFGSGIAKQALRGTTRVNVSTKRWKGVMDCLDDILIQVPQVDVGDRHSVDVTLWASLLAVGRVGNRHHKDEVVDMLLSLGREMNHAVAVCAIRAIMADEVSAYCIRKMCEDGLFRLPRERYIRAKKGWTSGVKLSFEV